jgi:hypothetical protein
MSNPHPNVAANMFGSSGFWAFAVVISIAWGAFTYFNGENEKADLARENTRIDTVATESAARATCTSWLQDLYDGPGYKLISLQTVGSSRAYRTFIFDAVVQRQAPVNKQLFQTSERCQMEWSHSDDAWDVRVR